MKAVDSSNLTKGMVVHYRYSLTTGEPIGPFKVQGFHRDHEGQHVTLREHVIGGDDRTVLLATDDDFGTPLFYTT